MTVAETLKLATQHHLAGRLAEAEQLYRQILANDAANADALHGLGLLARQHNRLPEAADLIRRAITLKPLIPRYHLNLGTVYAEMANLTEAAAAYAKAIALKPNNAGAISNLGDVYRRQGRIKEAVDACRRATVLQPSLVEAHHNLGLALGEAGELPQAIAALAKAASLRPDSAQIHNDWGAALLESLALTQAIPVLQRAIALNPNLPDAHNNLGGAFLQQRDFAAAASACRAALAINPNHVDALNNLGTALTAMDQIPQGIEALKKAASLKPNFYQAMTNLGSAYFNQGDYAQAIAQWQSARALKPDHPPANWNLGLARLLEGDYQQGWPLYQWRWQLREFYGRTNPSLPLWDGGDLNGRRILLHAEQGFGDAIQFVRYLPRVVARGGQIILAAHRELHELFQGMRLPIAQWVAPNQPLPKFDVHAPLMSLPMIFKTTLATIPADVPYLRNNPGKVEHWQKRLATETRRKIGLVWAGRANPDPKRTVPVANLAPLATIPNAAFISLQKPQPGEPSAPPPLDLIDWTGDLLDFSDTAALIQNLDLVITIDTAVAHLVGALGKPAFVLIPFVPDWRWLLNRDDSPWYPSMRLFRQKRMDDWTEPLQRVVQALSV